MFRSIRFVVVSALVLTGCLTAAELGRRILDGYRVWSVSLLRNPGSTDLTWSNGRPSEDLLRKIPLDVEADSGWFYERPPPIEQTAPEWAEKRRIAFDPGSNYVWNAARLKDPGLQAYLAYLRKNRSPGPADIFTFRSPNGEPYPLYRFYPEIQTGSGHSNRFGWRSRQVTEAKPPNVIRIAVLGDSTTNAYPGMVEYWLNLWAIRRNLGVRFEMINAARPASDPLDALAIFDVELGTIDPDYVITYGFGNGIHLADALIKLPPGVVRGDPQSAPAAKAGVVERLSKWVGDMLGPLARWSAAAGFLRSRMMGQRSVGSVSTEPPKPATRLEFPPDVDEGSPDPQTIANHTGGGLMVLETYLQVLNKIDAMARQRNIRLFVSTFRIMAFDGMLLGKGEENTYRVLNEEYWWPYSYAQIHRLTAFYNRALRAWAGAKRRGIIPIDEQMPWQPELYADGMHEVRDGEALHAWIVLQQLMPRIREDLAQHRLPQPARPHSQDAEQYWKIERTSVASILGGVPNSR
jgi:hypothetical protein